MPLLHRNRREAVTLDHNLAPDDALKLRVVRPEPLSAGAVQDYLGYRLARSPDVDFAVVLGIRHAPDVCGRVLGVWINASLFQVNN